jgi:aspartyl-tRNA(Asn)/glutamyl-tRNA(Gln) amidotransferase subunit C
MSPKLTTTEVKNIAKLARLELSDKEVEKFTTQLSDILNYVDQLQEVDTKSVEPMAQVTGLKNMTREDKVDQCEIQEDLVACAPENDGRLVKVKNVL